MYWLLTCNIHCLEFLEKHNTSIFSVLILFPAWSHAAKNRSTSSWRSCWEDVAVPNHPREASGWHVQLPAATCPSNRLWLFHQFIWNIKRRGDSTNHCRSLTLTVNGCDLTLPTRTQMSEQEYNDLTVKGCDQHRTHATLAKAFPEELSRILSRGRPNMCRRLWHTPKICRKFAGEWKSGL